MKISEQLNVSIDYHPYHQSLNKKLLKDESVANYHVDEVKHGDTALFSSARTTSKNIDLVSSWVQSLIYKHYPYLNDSYHNDQLPEPHTWPKWFVRYRVGDETKPHNHFPGLLSWVYFVKCPRGSSPLVFTTSGKRIKAQEGKVVIFPSLINHHVPKNRCEGRVALAGNVDVNLKSVHPSK